MNKSDDLRELAKALSVVQSKIEGAKKDSTNPFFKAKYADLSSVWEACRKHLADNGLAVVQTMSLDDRYSIVVDTTLIHSSGQWISGQLGLKAVKEDPQGAGSAITYARRYALAAIVGIAPEDDDAEAATQRVASKQPGKSTTQPPQKPASKPPQSTTEGSKADLSSMVWKDAGELKNYLKDNFKMDGNQIAEAIAGCILTTPEGRAKCWASILKTREE